MGYIIYFFDMIKEDLLTAFLGILILFVLFVINTLLGVYRGTKIEGFKITKLLEGIAKNLLCLMLPLFMFFAVLDFIPLWLERVGITGLEGIVTFIQSMVVIAIAIKNYVLDIWDKYVDIFGVGKDQLAEYQDYYG